MGVTVKEEDLPRQTFLMVRDSQVALVREIRKLIAEDRKLCLDDFETFFSLYQQATMGRGHRVPLNFTHRMPGSEGWSTDHVVLNMLTGEGKDLAAGFAQTQWQWKVAPGEVWTAVLQRLLGVIFGMALESAIQMSPERPDFERSVGERGDEEF